MIRFKNIGKLTQAGEELPFIPKRVYWIKTKGETRGGHAHIKLNQVITCIQGSFTLTVDNGSVKKYKMTEHSHKGVWLSWEWHTMENCSKDCIILVMASEFYNESDYIRDYTKWKEWKNGI